MASINEAHNGIQETSLRVAPRASALIESLRDIGYSLDTAVADIIDNSISAGAKHIALHANWNEGDPWFYIIDDGYGMSGDELNEAMRPGTAGPLAGRTVSDLGRFGLGLKTASFSQCRRLTVISRKDGVISGRCWDLDLIAQVDDWLLQILAEEECLAVPGADELPETGTLVLWEQLDRMLDSTEHGGTADRFYAGMDGCRKHLELVFHRFISGEPRRPKIRFMFNGVPLEAFDPFNSGHVATQILADEKFQLEGKTVKIQAFVLPHHKKTTKSDYEKYAGDEGYLKNQGFYIYRNGRLLTHGTWFRLARQSELTRLARVKIDIPNSLDHLWSIDVRKSRAIPPAAIRERLSRVIEQILGRAGRVYTQRGHKLDDKGIVTVWQRFADKNQIHYAINRDYPLLMNFMDDLDEQQQNVFKQLLGLIENGFPVDTLFADTSASPEKVALATNDDAQIIIMAESYYDMLASQGLTHDLIAKTFKTVEPFRSKPAICDKLLEKKRA